MIDLELRRKALEASGWTDVDYCGHPHFLVGIPPKDAKDVKPCDSYGGKRFRHAPAVESDPSAFWLWFLAWCGDRYWWRLEPMTEGFQFELCVEGHYSERVIGEGPTVEAAGCRAVIVKIERRV